MDTTSYIALSRQLALQRHMTALATNVANAGTSGYRAEHTLFTTALERAGVPGRLAFVQDQGLVRDLRPGPLVETGSRLDVAIDGAGYLAFQTPEGIGYSRAGHLAVDATGQLVDAGGNAVLDEGGAPVVVPLDDRTLTIAADGTIANEAGPIGRLRLVTFADERALERTGDSLYRTDQPPLPALEARVLQGRLESSNVRPVMEITSLLETVRAFEGTQKMLDTAHELDRRAIERLVATAA